MFLLCFCKRWRLLDSIICTIFEQCCLFCYAITSILPVWTFSPWLLIILIITYALFTDWASSQYSQKLRIRPKMGLSHAISLVNFSNEMNSFETCFSLHFCAKVHLFSNKCKQKCDDTIFWPLCHLII